MIVFSLTDLSYYSLNLFHKSVQEGIHTTSVAPGLGFFSYLSNNQPDMPDRDLQIVLAQWRRRQFVRSSDCGSNHQISSCCDIARGTFCCQNLHKLRQNFSLNTS